MPFANFDNRHFSADEKSAVTTALTVLEEALAGKVANLTPSERQQYGSVSEHNKLLINKVKDYRDSQPGLSSPDLDWDEFQNDHDTRSFLQTVMQRLEGLNLSIENAKILHDYDNYKTALLDYDYAKYKARNATGTGYETKITEIKQFFKGRPPSKADPLR